MTFLDNLGNFASDQLKQITNEIGWTALGNDIASITTNDKSWVGDAFQIAGDVFKGSLAGVTYLPRKALGTAFNDILLPVARTSYNVGGKYAREPLSAGLLGLATRDWQESWNQRGEISAGQAAAYLQSRFDPTKGELRGDFDIFDPNDRKVFDTNWEYRTLSGAYDTFFSTVTDPLGKVAKAGALARKALVLQPLGATDAGIAQLTKDFLIPRSTRNVTILSPQTLATKINEGRDVNGGLYNSMDWFAKNDKLAIRNHPMVAASNDADTLSYLLGEAKTTDDVADVLLATAVKDTEAMARLVAKRKDMAFVMDKLKPVSELDKQIINNIPTNAIVEDLNILDAAAEHVAYAMNDPYIKYITGLNAKGLDLTKRTFGTAATQRGSIRAAERQTSRALGEKPSTTSYPTLGIFQPTKYHPVVAVVNFAERWAGERPAGYFNANDSDSFNEIKAMGGMLRRLVGNDVAAPVIARHYDDFITAGDIPEARARVAKSFEELAIPLINKSIGLSDETGKYIWDAYKGRRKIAMDSMRDRKFLMTNDNTILKIPYLERQGANALPMVDLENYARVLKENSGLIKAIDGSHGIVDPDEFRYIAGILNDMWKASVLLRLGYTVRNVSEASMSILAKGYGLVAAAELSTEGVKKWYNNRLIGMDRLTDKTLVAKGLREDSIKLRQELASVQQDRAQIASLNKDIDEHMAAVEIAFKRGQLTEEQMLEFLDVSSYRTGEFMYHGSPTGLRSLNTNRPLAMSYSADIAERYADAGMPTISASEIYRRQTGRAYPMPKNLRSAETGALIKEGGVRKPSLSMQTIAADMRDGFINTISKGNQVELYSPSSGTWRGIDPNAISQKMLLEGTFRVRKPGNQGQILHSKVFGTPVDLRSNNGTGTKLGLNDYPELKKLGLDARKPDSWKGKEKELFDWMRANGVGKLTLPDVKANGRATVLVDPEMIETATNKPAQILAKRQLDAIRNTRAVTSNQSKVLQMIQLTVENGGGTFKFMTGDVPQGGFPVAVRGGTFQYSLDSAKANPEAMAQQLAEHIENTIGKFSEADHFGTWVAPAEDGTMHIWAEPVNLITDRAQAIKLGKERNQQKIYDLNIFEEINIGGTGDVGASEAFALGQSTKAVRSNVARGTQGVRPELSESNRAASLSELATRIGNGKYPTDGIVNLVRELADRDALVRANHENLLARLDARVVEESRLNAPKEMLGTGMRRTTLYDGTVIEHGDAFQGEPGQILAQRTDNADTYKMIADAPSQLFAARYGNMEEIRLSASDPRYFNGYANFLNNFFRSPTEDKVDPVIEMFLNNMTPESVVTWLRKDPKGIAYAEKMNIDDKTFKVASKNLNIGTDAEDFVGNLHSAYQRYLPDAEIQEAFRANQLDEMWLRRHFADTPAMPDIIGSTIPVGQRVKYGSQAGVQKLVEKAFYFLGSLPETTLARHPLARAVYRSEMQQRGNIALSLKRSQLNDPKAELTLDEINGLRKDAVESTRKEVNKTLFTIIRRSYAGEKMRYLMPFFSAWENTIRRWTTLSKDNPVAIAKAGQITATLSNQNNVVDRDGNIATTFSYDNVIVLPMPETFMKTMEAIPGLPRNLAAAIRSAGSQVSIPVRSLDVMFQGEPIAGFGPVVALPAGELEKMRPDFESILSPIIPFGSQEGNLFQATVKSVLPPYLQKAAQTWSGTRDGQWSRTFNTVYRYELIKYKLGERDTEPTFQDVEKLTNDMYRVKMLSNLILPFAAQYDSPLSWYTQQYRKLQQTYGMKADALFLQMYPEMAEATISASMNNTGVNASQNANSNIQKYKGLLSKIGSTSPEMIGFVVNDPTGKYDFSNAAYQWQMRNTPVPGSTTNFRGQRDPALLKQDANKKSGWIDYRKGMDYLDSQLYGQGFQSYSESGAEELNLMKQMYTQQLAQTNKDWAADFYSVDKGKWIYRMQTIKTILTDPEWVKDNASRPIVSQLAIYYNTRTQIARELASRKAGGGAASLEAEDNEDLNRLWMQTVATLRQESGGEFDAFYQRFLQNDPVTLG
jgi:hypothetical protein